MTQRLPELDEPIIAQQDERLFGAFTSDSDHAGTLERRDLERLSARYCTMLLPAVISATSEIRVDIPLYRETAEWFE